MLLNMNLICQSNTSKNLFSSIDLNYNGNALKYSGYSWLNTESKLW